MLWSSVLQEAGEGKTYESVTGCNNEKTVRMETVFSLGDFYMKSSSYYRVGSFLYLPKKMPSSIYLSVSETHMGNFPVATAV